MEISKNLNTNVILIIILILIVFSIIYIYTTQKGHNNTKITEGFAGNQYIVEAEDFVELDRLDNVLVGNQNIPLTNAINQLINNLKLKLELIQSECNITEYYNGIVTKYPLLTHLIFNRKFNSIHSTLSDSIPISFTIT